ncbi:hypothetical protein N665_1544s0005 [Sinapis alba]|nr:hypothetical protein N665_1544s0005 [Sinapis alba]
MVNQSCSNSGLTPLKVKVYLVTKSIINSQTLLGIIVTVTDVRGRVISWSSAGTCGFRGTRRGTPFAALKKLLNIVSHIKDIVN